MLAADREGLFTRQMCYLGQVSAWAGSRDSGHSAQACSSVAPVSVSAPSKRTPAACTVLRVLREAPQAGTVCGPQTTRA